LCREELDIYIDSTRGENASPSSDPCPEEFNGNNLRPSCGGEYLYDGDSRNAWSRSDSAITALHKTLITWIRTQDAAMKTR